MKDSEQLSAFLLHEPRTAEKFALSGDTFGPVEFDSASNAVRYARDCTDCDEYEVQVHFEGNDILLETIEQKRILVQFLEGFL